MAKIIVQTDFWFLCHMREPMAPCASWNICACSDRRSPKRGQSKRQCRSSPTGRTYACGAEGAPAQMPWHGWSVKPALLNWQSKRAHPEMKNGSELLDEKAGHNRALQNTVRDVKTSASMRTALPSLMAPSAGKCAALPRYHSHGQVWRLEWEVQYIDQHKMHYVTLESCRQTWEDLWPASTLTR